MKPNLLFLLVVICCFFVQSCATPSGPTGGPRDETGPKILQTKPETGTTNFSGDEVQFYFDEFIQRNSINNNITIEPEFGAIYKLKWKRKRLSIIFEDPLPDSSTIIVTLGGNVADTRGNKVGAPKIVAFSTGNEIDEASITGRLRSANTGEGMATQKIALYREPIDVEAPYNYTAETDTGGYFKFSYLREGNYKTFYFDDRNRNKIWDANNESAQPFRIDTVRLTKADTVNIGELYLQQRDTLAPRLQAIGLLSNKRMRFRFNEDIELSDSVEIIITDTLGHTLNSAFPINVPEDEAFILFAESDSVLSEEQNYEVSLSGIADNAGNAVIHRDVRFNGSAQNDTTLQRIIGIETEAGLFPTQPFVVRYATSITDRAVVDSLVVVEGDVTFDDWPIVGVDKNRLFIGPQDEWIDGIDYQFLVWNPKTQRRSLYTTEIWNTSEMGDLEIAINSEDSTGNYFYELVNEQNGLTYTGVMEKILVVDELPPLVYRLTVFKDENDNGIWDKGSVLPYEAPEPFIIRNRVNIRTGFTAQIIIDF